MNVKEKAKAIYNYVFNTKHTILVPIGIGMCIGVIVSCAVVQFEVKTMGTIADWFGAIGTIGAVWTSFYILNKSRTEKIIESDKKILKEVSKELYNVLQMNETIEDIRIYIGNTFENSVYDDFDEKYDIKNGTNYSKIKKSDSSYKLLTDVLESMNKLKKLNQENINKLNINAYFLNDKNCVKSLMNIDRLLDKLIEKLTDVISYYSEEFQNFGEYEQYKEHLLYTEGTQIISYDITQETTLRDIIEFVDNDLINIKKGIDAFDKDIKNIINKY